MATPFLGDRVEGPQTRGPKPIFGLRRDRGRSPRGREGLVGPGSGSCHRFFQRRRENLSESKEGPGKVGPLGRRTTEDPGRHRRKDRRDPRTGPSSDRRRPRVNNGGGKESRVTDSAPTRSVQHPQGHQVFLRFTRTRVK